MEWKIVIEKIFTKYYFIYSETPIYVVDNSSDDDSIEFLKKEYKNVEVIKLSVNIGYAKAYNYALKN